MRLICPNCGAQYEVPEDVIPDEGRDVQCSNCGDTWYQPSARMLAQGGAEADEPQVEFATGGPDYADGPQDGDTDAPAGADMASDAGHDDLRDDFDDSDDPEDAGDQWPEAPAPEPEDEPEDDPWAEDPDAPEEAPEPIAAAPRPAPEEPQKRRLDPEISRVLREEALRESALRSGRPENLETQTEMGLEDPSMEEMVRRTQQSQARMARMRGEPPAPPPPQPEPGSRRGLLPDIEDVNHSLSPGEAAPPPPREAAAPAPKKSGFSRGFFLVILIALLGMLVYSKAPAIAQKVPQADPYLSSYVAMVDQARLWLDAQAKALASE